MIVFTDNAPAVAPLPPEVKQTYRRTSFSGIVAAAAHAATSEHSLPGRGHDELLRQSLDQCG